MTAPLAAPTPQSERRARLLAASRSRLEEERRLEAEGDEELHDLEARVVEARAALERRRALADDARFLQELEDSGRGWLSGLTVAEMQQQLSRAEADHAEAADELRRAEAEERGLLAEIAALELELEDAEAVRSEAENAAERADARSRMLDERGEELLAAMHALPERQAAASHAREATEAMLREAANIERDAGQVANCLHDVTAREQEARLAEAEASRRLDDEGMAVAFLFGKALRDRAALESRDKFERRVLEERVRTLTDDIQRAKHAVLKLESQQHEVDMRQRAAERYEDYQDLLAMNANYALELEQAKAELALRPTAADLPVKQAQLQRQAMVLSEELARISDDLAATSEPDLTSQRAEELRQAVESNRNVIIPGRERKLHDLEVRVFELKQSIEQWRTDEEPRHLAFVARLLAEKERLQAEVGDMSAKRAAAAARAVEQHRQRAEWDAQREFWRKELARLGIANVEEGDAATPLRPRVVEVEVVEQVVRSSGDPDASPAPVDRRTTVVNVPAPPTGTHFEPASVLFETAPAAAASHDDRHFNFFAVSVMRSVIGLFSSVTTQQPRTITAVRDADRNHAV